MVERLSAITENIRSPTVQFLHSEGVLGCGSVRSESLLQL